MFAGIRPVIIKEFRQIKRDKRTLGMLLVIPGFLLIMYGYALNFDVKHISLAVYDQEKSQRSRDFYEKFLHNEYFDLKYTLNNVREIDELIVRGKVRVALVIPRGFSQDLLAGRSTAVQVIVDGEEASAAITAIGYIHALVQGYSTEILTNILVRSGRNAFELPVSAQPRVWYNPELRSANFLIPGLMAFILMITVVISTSFSVVREKERGTIEQIIISPVKSMELIIGKTVPYILISLISAHLVLLFGLLLFGVSIKGSYGWLLVGMLFFLIGGLGLGLFISTIANSQQVAFIIAVVSTMLPTFILSGFVFPIRNMPVIIQAFTYLIPAKYFLVILRSIILKGVGIAVFWSQLAFLATFAFLVIAVSAVRMKRIKA